MPREKIIIKISAPNKETVERILDFIFHIETFEPETFFEYYYKERKKV